MSAFENMPLLYIPKKRSRADIPEMQDRKDRLDWESQRARKKLRAHGSFNAAFWTAAAEVETIILSRTRVMSEISLAEFDGQPSAWQQTEGARNLFKRIRAQQHRVVSFQKQASKLTRPGRRSLREFFMNLFMSSHMGLGIKTDMGPRDSSEQSNFRDRLLQDYNSLRDDKLIWCPILHTWIDPENATAAHLFSYKHGQASMDAIFGHTRPAELFSSRNGLIIASQIEKFFDAGVLVIVPDIPERPTRSMLSAWLYQKTPREYKLRIIDSSWEKLGRPVLSMDHGTTWKDLDGRKLRFRSNFRPAARYLYFHYCLQVLRRAWKVGPGQRAAFHLQDELGKPFWGTPGRYMARNMLRALVEELGHEYESLMDGATLLARGDSGLLIDTAAAQITSEAEEENETESEDFDEEEFP
ncbi:hypothetical protein ASPZODRAFT_152732 [Penicilliopsis zonata CBS 506.65]|uniref:HNH nuclease domain-containing protein n=1 Tax=Penicilliopsis zonata CBS 506.65 TaxID=1073090 RepID=A0A1L9SEN8_9EURO|nr:hypothetical protein ASPZODRAFT_152732 [Penicilliopsis zonata CBS 506.65]OJJ45725.1 hypothetical protein ASPZODRAFT_152732 [Penicilliopsis zonata CBS 506.65]